MGKNKKMFKLFIKALKNDKEAIALLTPDSYQENIYVINYNKLKKKGIKYILFDIDNTILPVNSIEIPEKLQNLINKLTQDFKICLLSNNSLNRVKPVAEELKIPYLANAGKPGKKAFIKAISLLAGTKENTTIIGDQLLSDIAGGNTYGIYTILVDSLKNHYNLPTGVNKIFQSILIRKIDKIKKHEYY